MAFQVMKGLELDRISLPAGQCMDIGSRNEHLVRDGVASQQGSPVIGRPDQGAVDPADHASSLAGAVELRTVHALEVPGEAFLHWLSSRWPR